MNGDIVKYIPGKLIESDVPQKSHKQPEWKKFKSSDHANLGTMDK